MSFRFIAFRGLRTDTATKPPLTLIAFFGVVPKYKPSDQAVSMLQLYMSGNGSNGDVLKKKKTIFTIVQRLPVSARGDLLASYLTQLGLVQHDVFCSLECHVGPLALIAQIRICQDVEDLKILWNRLCAFLRKQESPKVLDHLHHNVRNKSTFYFLSDEKKSLSHSSTNIESSGFSSVKTESVVEAFSHIFDIVLRQHQHDLSLELIDDFYNLFCTRLSEISLQNLVTSFTEHVVYDMMTEGISPQKVEYVARRILPSSKNSSDIPGKQPKYLQDDNVKTTNSHERISGIENNENMLRPRTLSMFFLLQGYTNQIDRLEELWDLCRLRGLLLPTKPVCLSIVNGCRFLLGGYSLNAEIRDQSRIPRVMDILHDLYQILRSSEQNRLDSKDFDEFLCSLIDALSDIQEFSVKLKRVAYRDSKKVAPLVNLEQNYSTAINFLSEIFLDNEFVRRLSREYYLRLLRTLGISDYDKWALRILEEIRRQGYVFSTVKERGWLLQALQWRSIPSKKLNPSAVQAKSIALPSKLPASSTYTSIRLPVIPSFTCIDGILLDQEAPCRNARRPYTSEDPFRSTSGVDKDDLRLTTLLAQYYLRAAIRCGLWYGIRAQKQIGNATCTSLEGHIRTLLLEMRNTHPYLTTRMLRQLRMNCDKLQSSTDPTEKGWTPFSVFAKWKHELEKQLIADSSIQKTTETPELVDSCTTLTLSDKILSHKQNSGNMSPTNALLMSFGDEIVLCSLWASRQLDASRSMAQHFAKKTVSPSKMPNKIILESEPNKFDQLLLHCLRKQTEDLLFIWSSKVLNGFLRDENFK